ncbi:NAD-dependent succinate-semialdehyde dehydrogenase [Phenylobacterium sp. LjRoot219]|uniref:NAD-dependent succinate-semialdehyde dehydrogenase n=1 Tax=Phenylobacterium sp. LjRoot219 TaxID=3342283 RepID=UPI003ECEB46C
MNEHRPPASSTDPRPHLAVVDPATGQPGRTYEGHARPEAHAIIARTRSAFEKWRLTPIEARAAQMRKAAEVLRRRAPEFARLMTDEMGKPHADGLAEVEKCAFNCEFFADKAADFLARRPVDVGGPKAFVTYNPLGVVLAVMPWNFPFWQVFRFAAPTLMAGNAAVLKHASNVPGCALAIEEVFREAGFPADLFRSLLIPGRDVAAMIDDPNVAAVTLTGSVGAGREVAKAAGGALKKLVLELGGSDAYLVLDDADIDKAATIAATARMVNGGQSCIAGKRFIVLKAVKAAFETALAEKLAAYPMGDPHDPATKLGPLSSVHARDEIHDQVVRSLAGGARLLCGGQIPDKPGAWYPATLLTDVRPGQPAHDDELFGPVAAIIEAPDEATAIKIANDSDFGLGSGVLTGDPERGERIAAEALEAGMSFVNANVRSDPRLPFGGVKHSGYGRECADFGIYEFVNVKTVLVQG